MTMTTLDVLRIFGPCDATMVCKYVPGTEDDIRSHFAILASKKLAWPVGDGCWDLSDAGVKLFKARMKRRRELKNYAEWIT